MNEVCTDNRFEIIAKAKEALLDSTNIESSPDEMKVLNNFLFRCWQMGWLDKYEKDLVEVVRCKNCKHKPHTKEPDGDGYGFDITADGDFTCPFLCDDGYYNRMPSDDFYCSYGE